MKTDWCQPSCLDSVPVGGEPLEMCMGITKEVLQFIAIYCFLWCQMMTFAVDLKYSYNTATCNSDLQPGKAKEKSPHIKIPTHQLGIQIPSTFTE